MEDSYPEEWHLEMTIPDITNSEIDRLIGEWIHSERDRRILHRRLIDGICIEPLAEEFDMSVSQIKRIIVTGSRTIFSKI